MPSARAPSMSSSYESPTIAVSCGAASSAEVQRREIDACGLTRPCSFEPTTASTSSRWCVRELVEVALAVRDETDP